MLRLCGLEFVAWLVPAQPQCQALWTGVAGVPTGWNNNNYWSATPSPSGHASVTLSIGNVSDLSDSSSGSVAYQVL